MQTHAPLHEQIFQFIDEDPTLSYDLETITKGLKSTPQKREIIKTLNKLASEKKIIKLNDDGKVKYKTATFVPKDIKSSDTVELSFIDLEGETFDSKNLKNIEKKCWKKFKVIAFATFNYCDETVREINNDNLKIMQHKFSNSVVIMSWTIQEVLNTYKNEKLAVKIVCKNSDKKHFTELAEIVKNRGYKCEVL